MNTWLDAPFVLCRPNPMLTACGSRIRFWNIEVQRQGGKGRVRTLYRWLAQQANEFTLVPVVCRVPRVQGLRNQKQEKKRKGAENQFPKRSVHLQAKSGLATNSQKRVSNHSSISSNKLPIV